MSDEATHHDLHSDSAPDPLVIFLSREAFPLGRLVATPGAVGALKRTAENPADFLQRHVNRDWGDLSEADRDTNDEALETGGSLLSAYYLDDGTRLWIVTEGDRSVTTLLLPIEY